MLPPSLRYNQGSLDARSLYIRFCAWLQGQPIAFIDDNPKAIGAVLASSANKGRFLEERIACPAWEPVLSVESVDGPVWRSLASTFRTMFRALPWRERTASSVRAEFDAAALACAQDPTRTIDAEDISRICAGALHSVVFGHAPTDEVRNLLFEASIQWRREIAIKGRGDKRIKQEFMVWLEAALRDSEWAYMFEGDADPAEVISVFAQPIFISPQINIADIMVTVFDALSTDATLRRNAMEWARSGDDARLLGLAMEGIRVAHPFPVLERWLNRDVEVQGHRYHKGTQVFMMMDTLKQDATIDPERWIGPRDQNPYADLPFGSGPRMCTGRPLAERLLVELLRGLLLSVPEHQLRPQDGNIYSGRKNDGKDDLTAIWHQVVTFATVLIQSVKLGARGEGKCPFHRA